MKIAMFKALVRGETRWCVSHRPPGAKRQRKFFTSREKAQAEVDDLKTQAGQAGTVWLSLSPEERLEASQVLLDARQAGFSLRQVWDGFRNNGAAQAASIEKPLGECIKECLASKLVAGRRSKYVESLERYLGRFAAGREQAPINRVSVADIDEFLKKQVNAWSRSTWLNRLSTLFSFAVRRGWLVFNPCERIERISIDVPVATILSVEQARSVLEFIRKQHARGLAWFSLALLAGVRPEECDRLSWADVDLERGMVTMGGAATKTRQRRIITLEANAVEWLRLARKKGAELPLPAVTRRRYLRDLRKHLGFEKWPKDILRKTAASYLMGKYRDAGKVAEVLGNSAGVLLKHYRELVHQEEAGKYWGIRPEGLLTIKNSTSSSRTPYFAATKSSRYKA